jgi:hypothetical protein
MNTERFYVLQVIGDVEPHLHGPFDTADERDDYARTLSRECDDDLPDGIYRINATGQISVDAYYGGELETEDSTTSEAVRS